MKLLIRILFLTLLVSYVYTKVLENTNTNYNAVESEEELKKKKNRSKNRLKSRKSSSLSKVKQAPSVNGTNLSFINTSYAAFNNTYSTINYPEFKFAHSSWDYKVMDKQFEEIYKFMLTKNVPYKTIFSDRAFVEIFLQQFDKCDANKDQTLTLDEFKACMKTDPYLSKITPPPAAFASNANYTNPDYFYQQIFDTLDVYRFNFLNFHSYMEFRMFVYSWRKCSVMAPFIEETSWECAISIVIEGKTKSRTTLRNTFYMALGMSNSSDLRNIDFLSFMMFGAGARLFGKINGKEDGDISLSEFNLVLDENMLPARYNQKVVTQFFQLMKENDQAGHGIDFQSFIFYDYALRLFDLKNATRRYYANELEFIQILSNPLFNNDMMTELSQVPLMNLTANSYQMYTYQNIANFNDEGDFLLKFVEKESNRNKASKGKFATRQQKFTPGKILESASNVNFSIPLAAHNIFNVMDVNSDGYIDFYDFGTFYSTLDLFTKFDSVQKGKFLAGEIYEKFTTYSDFPKISTDLKKRATRFSQINQDTYVDWFTTYIILRIDDIISLYTRQTDKTTLYEVELKRIFAKVNLNFINDGVLNKCLRGNDLNNIPKYDWECAFIAGAQKNIDYIESASSYNTAKLNNLTLTNTVFYNVDASLNAAANAPAAKRRFF